MSKKEVGFNYKAEIWYITQGSGKKENKNSLGYQPLL